MRSTPDADLFHLFTVPDDHAVVLTPADDRVLVWVTCSCGVEVEWLPAETRRTAQWLLDNAHRAAMMAQEKSPATVGAVRGTANPLGKD
jgi:hypothetical protein